MRQRDRKPEKKSPEISHPKQQQPQEPKPSVQPTKPAQQFFIPSSNPKKKSVKSESQGSVKPAKQPRIEKDDHHIPVMRRHGEPLMMMPDWMKPESHEQHDQPQTERGHYDMDARGPENETDHDFERSFFEREAHPFRIYPEDSHHYRSQQLNGYDNIPQNDQKEDDLAHAIIDTFSQVAKPILYTQEDDDNEVDSNLARRSQALILETANTDHNKIVLPKFHYTGDGTVRAEPPKTGFSESSSSSESERSVRADQSSSSSSTSTNRSVSSEVTVEVSSERHRRDTHPKRRQEPRISHRREPRRHVDYSYSEYDEEEEEEVVEDYHRHRPSKSRGHRDTHLHRDSHRPHHKRRHDSYSSEMSPVATHHHHHTSTHHRPQPHHYHHDSRHHHHADVDHGRHAHRYDYEETDSSYESLDLKTKPHRRQQPKKDRYEVSESSVESSSSSVRARKPAPKRTGRKARDVEDESVLSSASEESNQNQGGEYYDDDDDDDDDVSSSEDGDELALDEEQIIDYFEQAMRLLRKQSHGFNLEQAANGFDLDTVKNMLRNGDFLEKQKHVADWEPHAIQPKDTDSNPKQVTDYWYQSGTFLNKEEQQRKGHQIPLPTQSLSLKELLADEAQLIKDYEDKIKAKEEKRKAQMEEELKSVEQTAEHVRPIVRKEEHGELDYIYPAEMSHFDTTYSDQFYEAMAPAEPHRSSETLGLNYDYLVPLHEQVHAQPAEMILEDPYYSNPYHYDYDYGYAAEYAMPAATEHSPFPSEHQQDAEYYEQHYHPQRQYWNELLPNMPQQENKKPKKGGAPAADDDKSQTPHSKEMKEEMDYLAHQRLLKDRSMRRKKQLPTPPIPQKQGKPTVPGVPGDKDKPFDMMSYMKAQRLAKEKEMLEKEREDPHYKPLSPTAHKKPAVPLKDQDKLDEAERKMHKALPPAKKNKRGKKTKKRAKDESLVDQINKEKMLREKRMREADPSYEGPLTPTAKPKKPVKGGDQPEEKEDTIFEQMRRARAEHEQMIREEDAKRAAEDPNYKPRFKPLPSADADDKKTDKNYNLKKRLEEERRKHRQEYEEQFEEDLYEQELYGADDDDDYYSEDEQDGGLDSYSDDSDSDDDDEYGGNLDYYYDAQGFAHPKKSKDSFGYGRYHDAYKYHYNPYSNEGFSSEDDYYTDDDDDYYGSEYDSEEDESSEYDNYDPFYRHRQAHDDRRYSTNKKSKRQNRWNDDRRSSSRYGHYQNELLSSDPVEYTAYDEVPEEAYYYDYLDYPVIDDYYYDQNYNIELSEIEHELTHEELVEGFLARPDGYHYDEVAEAEPLEEAPHVPLATMPKIPKAPHHGDFTELSPQNFSPAKLKRWLEQKKGDEEVAESPVLLMLLETILEEEPQLEADVSTADDFEHHSEDEMAEETNLDAEEEAQDEVAEGDDMDLLLKEVQKELHTRFKNMFEGEMLLPNLEFNPEYEGKLEANLLSLEELEALAASSDGLSDDDAEYLMSLAQQHNGQASNRLSPFRHWVPRYLRDIESKDEEYHRENRSRTPANYHDYSPESSSKEYWLA